MATASIALSSLHRRIQRVFLAIRILDMDSDGAALRQLLEKIGDNPLRRFAGRRVVHPAAPEHLYRQCRRFLLSRFGSVMPVSKVRKPHGTSLLKESADGFHSRAR